MAGDTRDNRCGVLLGRDVRHSRRRRYGELVLVSLFFPEHLSVAFPIALAIGELIDPPATMVNAAGDYVVSFIVSRYVDGRNWLQKKLKK